MLRTNGTMDFRSTTYKFKLLFVTNSTTFLFYLYGKARALLSSQFLAFLTTEVQHCTQSLGSRIMHPGLMVSYIEGKRMIIIYCYALKQRNQSVDVTYISTDRCL